jgi:hypothetical protein
MQTIRRLYLYLMSGITLGVLLVGLNMLLTVVFHALGLGRGSFAGGSDNDREQLSLAIALIVVGLLVWTVHWLFVERSLRAENPAHDDERASGVRALYLTVVLAALLVAGVLAGIQLLQEVVRSVLGVEFSPEFGFGSNVDHGATLATLLVTSLAWTYHAAIRRRDLASGPLEGSGAWIPRVYLYGAALVGLILTAISLGNLATTALHAVVGDVPDVGDGAFERRAAADAIAGILGWGTVFLGHWWYATGLSRDTRWRGVSERRARLRVAYFVAAIGASAVGVVVFAFQALNAALNMALGVDDIVTGGGALLTIGGPLLALLPWAVAWILHWHWMRAESMEADGPGWIATVDRLDAGVVSLIGLVAASVGVGGLIGLLIDILLGGNRAFADFWRRDAAGYLAIALPGAVLWLWNWGRLQSRHAAAPEGEAGSSVRRAYLLMVMAASLIVSLASLAYLLYRLFGAILEVQQSDNAASAIAAPLGALLVAAALTIYHGMAVQRDQALRAASAAAAPELAAANVVAAAPPRTEPGSPTRRVLVLSGPPGTDLDITVAALRAALAPELQLDDGSAAD